MKMKRFKTMMVCGCAGALLTATAAQGATVEPDDFAAGTNISVNPVPGVTSLHLSGAFVASGDNVFARAPESGSIGANGGASTGDLVFGFNDSFGFPALGLPPGQFTSVNGSRFEADFSDTVNTVSLDFLSNGTAGAGGGLDGTSASLTALDASGNQLDQATSDFIPGGTFQTLTVNSASDIASIIATTGLDGARGQQGANLDNLVFNAGGGGGGNAVPTPTAALAGITLLGGMFLRRRRRAA